MLDRMQTKGGSKDYNARPSSKDYGYGSKEEKTFRWNNLGC